METQIFVSISTHYDVVRLFIDALCNYNGAGGYLHFEASDNDWKEARELAKQKITGRTVCVEDIFEELLRHGGEITVETPDEVLKIDAEDMAANWGKMATRNQKQLRRVLDAETNNPDWCSAYDMVQILSLGSVVYG